MGRTTGDGQRADIQGLRGVAVLLVVAAHAGVPGLAGGFVGVDVFFVVSGFLITGLLVREAEATGRVRLSRFYARRARRILPAATVTLAVVLAWAAERVSLDRLDEIRTDVAWAAAFLANVHLASLGGYQDADRAVSPVQHFWSLAVEEQFYLVWPALLAVVALLARRRRRTAVVVAAVAWVASFGWAVVGVAGNPESTYFSAPARAWELATGALLALAAPRLTDLSARARWPLGMAGLAAVATAAVVLDDTAGVPGWPTLLPVMGAAAVLAAGLSTPSGGAGRLLGVAPLRWVGDISYSLYLWHWPVLVLGAGDGARAGAQTPARTAILVVIALLAAVASYHLVEQPFRHGRLPFSRGRTALVLWPAALALVLGVSLVAGQVATARHADELVAARSFYDEHPTPQRVGADPRRQVEYAASLAERGAPVPPDLANLDRLNGDLWQYRYDCIADFEAVDTRICPVGDTGAERTVVVLGDSHAGMWLPALDALGRRDGYAVVYLVKLGCAPYDVTQRHDGRPFPSCEQFREWSRDRIARLKPDAVVVAGRAGWAYAAPPGVDEAESWGAAVGDLVETLRDDVPTVAVLADTTVLPWRPGDCLTAPGATLADCTAEEDPDVVAADRAARLAVRTAGGRWVDVTDWSCTHDHRCPSVAGGLVVFHDTSHLTATWVRRLAPLLGRALDLDFLGSRRSHP